MSGAIGGIDPAALLGVMGGPAPFVDTSQGGVNGQSGGITFSYGWATVAQSIALNQALATAGTGIQINGYNWSWNITNGVPGMTNPGTLYGNVLTKDALGNVLHQMSNDYSGQQITNQTFSGTVVYTNPYSLTTANSLSVEFVGKDGNFWAGFYGPKVRDISLSVNYGVDPCAANPLSSPSCPGYAAAMFAQQCSANPLSDPACPGYAAAYFTQQCTVSSLYSPACPGYAAAFLTQQCTANPLYSDACPGYQTASQQCTDNPLTASYCPAYESASMQCSANALTYSYCPGYSTAQATCSTNPLSNTLCSGYTTASQTCTANSLTYSYCPNYTTTLAACSTNPQSNSLCPGYGSSGTASSSTATTSPTTTVRSTTEATVAVDSLGKVETTVSKTGDSNVDRAITSTTTSATPSATAPVQLAPAPEPVAATATVAGTAKESKSDNKSDSKSTGSSQQTASTVRAENKQDAKSSNQKQEMQQAAQARAREEMKKAETAPSFEGQVAVQQVVIGAMNFVPGFDTYATGRIVDVNGLQMQRQYSQPNVDNRSVMRQLSGASDALHRQMVDQQWR